MPGVRQRAHPLARSISGAREDLLSVTGSLLLERARLNDAVLDQGDDNRTPARNGTGRRRGGTSK
jgi:hypothetical protein